MACTDNGTSPEPGAARLAALLRRVIQRGTAPPLHPEAERIVLEGAGLADAIEPTGLPGDCSVRVREGAAIVAPEGSQYTRATPPLDLDSNLVLALDSEEERIFLTEWLPRVSADAARWAVPQAPLESLASSADASGTGARRVDFLLSPGAGGPAFVVEIDGAQHADDTAIDHDRDEILAQAGYDVLRVPAAEVRRGAGAHLDGVAGRLADPAERTHPREGAGAVLGDGPIEVHRTVLALAEALASGLLRSDHWAIHIDGGSAWLPEAIVPYLDLLLGFDRVWALAAAPATVRLSDGARVRDLRCTRDGYKPSPHQPVSSPTITLLLEPQRGPWESLPAHRAAPAVVVRSAALSAAINLAFDLEAEAAITAPPLPTSPDDLSWGLTQVLRGVFAKEAFLPGQLEALTEVLAGRDCAVLLPTGGGKSLIYQLAGLCLPGRTLVIDPIIALMEDQVAGLEEHGVDRAAALSSHTTLQDQTAALLQEVASGDALFVFVAPERLQIKEFREAIRTLAHSPTPITLAVIDEAHCVSEWGHAFRPAYLNIGKVVRDVCQDAAGKTPALLALTGTASRAVLKDMLFELGIEQRSENTVVRPRSFDRPELRYDIRKLTPEEAEAALAGVFQSLPARFHMQPAEFFSPRGDRTHSGIVFCPHVNGDYGVVTIAERVGAVIGSKKVSIYSGKPPRYRDQTDWENRKRDNARDFKENAVPVLVATKAFGMGIDKPNVRYVVHFGMPSSIEAYYQEVGRAGRDKDPAHCTLILIEYAAERDRDLLAEDTVLEEARAERDAVGRAEEDDVTRQLFFHHGSFQGIDREVADVQRLLNDIGEWGRMREHRLPFWQRADDGDGEASKKGQERAIHRLVVLGIVRDYRVEWGSKAFSLSLANVDSQAVVGRYVYHVRRSQPARAESARMEAAQYKDASLADATVGCALLLIRFVYEFVEGSRRRSLREMWLAARDPDSIANPNKELRKRVLDYLTEGDLAPVLEQLAESPDFSYSAWIERLQAALPNEARELRGNAARLLASYPDHPGLLLARGFAEILDPAGDLEEIALHIESSLRSARDRYRVGSDELKAVATWLRQRCAGVREGPLTAVAIGLATSGAGADVVASLYREALTADTAEPGLRILAFVDALEGAVRELDRATRELEGDTT